MYDIIVIGSGPAGLSAGMNACVRNKKVKIIGNNIKSSYLYKAENVDNYLGFKNITGKKMMEKFFKHIQDMEVEYQEGKVDEIYSMGDFFSINANNDFIDAKSIIIATGLAKNNFFKGEEEYIGKGVSYCATCDGNLYRGKNIIIIGESKECEEDVKFLSEIAKNIVFIPKYKNVKVDIENVEIKKGNIKEIVGEDFANGIIIDKDKIDADGIFIIRNTVPIAKLIDGLEIEKNSIKVNRFMETNIKGVFAAGDCTGRPFQVAKAVGEGLIAGLQASTYISKLEVKKMEVI